MTKQHFGRLVAGFSLISLLPFSPALQAQKPGGGKPVKVAWSPSRVENSHVAGGVVTVQVTADGDALGATLRPTPSLAGFISVPAGPIDLLANTPTQIDLQVLMTPDEAGQTIGGTIHVIGNGKNLAQPLVVSLQQTTAEEDDEDEGSGPGPGSGEDDEDDDGNKPAFITWSDGSAELEALTPELVPGGSGQVEFIPSLDLTNVILWPTPSLSRCLDAVISPTNAEQPGVFEWGPNGEMAFVAAGVPVLLDLTMPVPPDQLTGGCGGTLHVRNAGKPRRTWSRPLNVRLGPDDENEELSENVAPSAAVGGASFELRPIAPGQIVSVFGTGLGPSRNALFELDQNGAIGETVAGTMVFFDGVPARILSVRNDQVNVIVPYGLEGTDVELLVVRGAYQSTPFPIPLRRAAPELFTLTGAGQGQVVAFNEDGTLNRSTNRAAVPSTVILFGTGAGQTVPPLAEGEIATAALPLAKPVRVFVGGVEANLTYAGTSPGQVGSLTQFNIELGAGTPPGQQPVQLIVDGIESTQKATLAVK